MRCLLPLVLLLTSCGQLCERDWYLNILYMEFLDIIPMNGANVCSIQYGDTGDAIGIAESDSLLRCDILVRPGLLPLTLRAVIAHESIHCLGYGHVNQVGHIMYPIAASEKYLDSNLEKMYIDLRNHVKESL